MTSDDAHPAAHEPDNGAEEKKSSRARANDMVKTGADAAVELLGGVADAFGGAVRKAGEEIDKDDVTRLTFKNGLLRGVVEGAADFLDKMPGVIRNSYDVLLSSADEEEEEKKPRKKRTAR
jgi:hypothetical protein